MTVQLSRRSFCQIVAVAPIAGALSACSQTSIPSPTAPDVEPTPQPANQLQPSQTVTSPNGTVGKLSYYGYANQNESLLEALARGNFSPVTKSTLLGDQVTSLLGNAPTYGWMFYVQDRFFGANAETEQLNSGDLWAAYEKQSLG